MKIISFRISFPILNLEAHWQISLEVHFCRRWCIGTKGTSNYIICFKCGGEGKEILSHWPRGSLFSIHLCLFFLADTAITLKCSGLWIFNEDTPYRPRKLCSHIFSDVSLGYERRTGIWRQTTAAYGVLYGDRFLCLSEQGQYTTMGSWAALHSEVHTWLESKNQTNTF